MKNTWVISVGDGWGHFFFEGTEKKAEEMRCHKANWEHAMTKKRLATEEEIKTKEIDRCWNHPNFKNTNRYHCDCEKCQSDELIKAATKINNWRSKKLKEIL